MAKTRVFLAASAFVGFALIATPLLAEGTPVPPPPEDDKGKQKSKKTDDEFLRGYRQAYDLIQGGDYSRGIAALHALGHDEHPDVANYLGYAHRKLGAYDLSRVWYERALSADPAHTRTWQYYGLWHLEQGNRLKAQDHLETIRLLCGTDCGDYRSLKTALESTNFTY